MKNLKKRYALMFVFPILLIFCGGVYYFFSFWRFLYSDVESKITQENINRAKSVNQSIDSLREITFSFADSVSRNPTNFMPIIKSYTERFESAVRFYVADTKISQVYFSTGSRQIPFMLQYKFSDIEKSGLRIDGLVNPNTKQFMFSFSVPMSKESSPRYYAGCLTNIKNQFPVLVEPLYFENGYSYIFGKDGTIFFNSDFARDDATDAENIFDKLQEDGMPLDMLQKMRRNVTRDRTGHDFYKAKGKWTLNRYIPLETRDWFILSSIPEFKFSEQVDRVLAMTSVMVVLFTFYTTIVVVLISRDISERKRLFQKFLSTDPLTGGMSLSAFKKAAKKYIGDHPSASMFMMKTTISNLIVINDRFGFLKGSNVLILAYMMLNEFVGDAGYCCHDNKGVFYILVNKDKKSEFTVAFESQFLKRFNQKLLEMGIDFAPAWTSGVYAISNETNDIEDILVRTEYVYEQAKERGTAEILQYDEEMRHSIIKIQTMQASQSVAIENSQFFLLLQPKYSLADGALIGAESFVRWQLNADEVLNPADFLPVFEKNGFVVEMDLHVIELVCSQIRIWIDSGFSPIQVSVNQSRQTLMSEGYFEKICSIVEKYKIQHEFLDIEITETFMYEDSDYFDELIKKMRYYGFLISIGDFGSKYSSLALLRDLPSDTIKIDRSFLYKAENDERTKAILSSIIEMAKNLGMKAIVEGVETKAQLDLLRQMNCFAAQGNRLGRPVAEKDFLTFYLNDAAIDLD